MKFSKLLLKEIDKKRIFTFYDVYDFAEKHNVSVYKIFKELAKLKKANKIESVWIDIEEEKISPISTLNRGFIIKNDSKPAPILSSNELDKLFSDIEI